jgi:DNA protecting protein DprA
MLMHTRSLPLKPKATPPGRGRRPRRHKKAPPRAHHEPLPTPESPPGISDPSKAAMPEISQGDLYQESAGSGQVPGDMPFAVALLALGSVKGFGPKALRSVVHILGDDLGRMLTGPDSLVIATLEEANVPAPAKLAKAILADRAKLTKRGADELGKLERRGVQVIPPSCLPSKFRDVTPDTPHWLFVEGDARVLERRPTVAVVGTRKPTEKGLRAAEIVTKVLAPYPIVLISGLAEGIDEMAHSVSLDQGVRNLAFLGHGINTVFPESTARLRRWIYHQGGAVATEYLPEEGIQRRFFVERNRLQAALADIVIPVEGDEAGGTAHTVRFARQYGRRLVGTRWPEARGLVNLLERESDPVVDIFTTAGCRELDRIFQALVEQYQQEAYPLALTEQNLLREVRSRSVRPEHVYRLINRLERVAADLERTEQPKT